MRARHELHKLAAGGRLYNFGGDDSQSTTNRTDNYDQRQVYTYDTTNYDLSNRSTTNTTTNTTTNADFSDRSTTNLWSDSSNRSVNTSNTTTSADFSDRSTNNTTINNTSTDGGAVSGALSLATGAVKSVGDQLGAVLGFASQVVDGQNAGQAHAYDYADHIFHGALDAVQASDTRALDAFTRASTIENDALAMTKSGFSSALGLVQNAYADAKGTTEAQQKIMMGVLLVAAVAVVAPRLGK